MLDIVITGGTAVLPSGAEKADIGIQGEKIVAIGAPGALAPLGGRVVDATGQIVIPGGIDPHTHMELPFGGTQSSDDFFTGTRAAAFGGTTTIIDFAVQNKGESLTQGVDKWHAKADSKCAIDYGFHLITTEFEDGDEAEMYRVMDEGITSFKLFMAYPGVFLADDATISAFGKLMDVATITTPNLPELKRLVRDRVAPSRHLGHTEKADAAG